MARGIVRLEVENLGTELWLVSNPHETQTAFDQACATGEFTADSPLDEASDVSRNCLVLQAHWGTDIPREPDLVWRETILASTRLADREEVAAIIAARWREE